MDNLEDDVKTLWQDTSLTKLDKVKALYHSLLWQRDPITLWLMQRPDMREAMEETSRSGASGRSTSLYWDLIFSRRPNGSENNWLTSSIDERVEFLLLAWARTGPRGDLHLVADVALHLFNGRLEPRALNPMWYVKQVDGLVLVPGAGGIAERGLPASEIQELDVSHTVHTKDLRSLGRAADDALQRASRGACLAYFRVLVCALRAGWAEGARLLVQGPVVSKLASACMLEAAMEGASLDCLDVLLGLGRNWQEVAFSVAFLEARFTALEHVVERGFGWCLGPPGSLIARLPCARNAEPTRHGTVEGLLTACVLALIQAARDGRLACEICSWREPACLLLRWWGRESCARRREGSASTHLPHVLEGISPTHLPGVLQGIIQRAGIVTPRGFQRAAAVAAKICEHEEIAFPVQI